MLAVLRDYLGADLQNYTLLDLGCSAGVITHEMAQHFKTVVGVDTDWPALQDAFGRWGDRVNLQFVFADGLTTPFPDRSFDVLLCAQIYEHVVAQTELACEIWRVLKPGGVCFFSGPNRWAIMEEHYWLPFLSWLPRPAADLYMRWLKRGRVYDIYPRSQSELQRLWSGFEIHDYTLAILRDPDRFAVGDQIPWLRLSRYSPEALLRLMSTFIPNYNWILAKPK
ncbi:MAG: class I SAM-dependent methyltransferase [Anaerolineales bacterium]